MCACCSGLEGVRTFSRLRAGPKRASQFFTAVHGELLPSTSPAQGGDEEACRDTQWSTSILYLLLFFFAFVLLTILNVLTSTQTQGNAWAGCTAWQICFVFRG